MLTKTQIKDLLKRHDLHLKKKLGQNLLIDKNARDKIIRLIGLEKDDVVLEIGPGLGALTEGLARECGRVYAIEKDSKLHDLVKDLLSKQENLEIIRHDFLEFDLNSLQSVKIKVVGALPYYITSPIIQHLINYRKKIDAIFIIVQKEVARRLAAQAGDDDYGALSLFVQFYSDVEMLMDIKRDLFFPRPDVDSALVKLKVLQQPHVAVRDEKMLFKVIRTSFNQRRKTLLTVLSRKNVLDLSKDQVAELLDNLNIDKKIRPESLTLGQFAEIANGIIDFLL